MDAQIKRVLVTGATGYIGSNLTKVLIDQGCEVHIIIRPSSNIGFLKEFEDLLTIHIHDGTTEKMISILKAANPDIVFHLASFSTVEHHPNQIERMITSNIVFSTQLVEAMVTNNNYYLINTGTCLQHYKNMNYNPSCLYSATKQAFEDILQYYLESTPLKNITLKLFNIYGPNDPHPRVFTLLQKSAEYNIQAILSPGEQLLNFVYIDDVIKGYVIAANRLKQNPTIKNESFALSSDEVFSLRELVDIYVEVSGNKLKIKWGGRSYRPREVMSPWNKGKRLPEWNATTTLREGIKKIILDSKLRRNSGDDRMHSSFK